MQTTTPSFMSLVSKIKRDKPWLIVGKGPSFSHIESLNFQDYYIFGLNHVIDYLYCHIWLWIDLEVLREVRCKSNYDYLCIPYHVHCDCKVSQFPLTAYPDILSLKNLHVYNQSTHKGCHVVDSPIIQVRYFSAEAAFEILGYLGIKDVQTIGIDGGTDYAPEFSHLKPLTNGRKSFDDQFKMLDQICKRHKMTWKRL